MKRIWLIILLSLFITLSSFAEMEDHEDNDSLWANTDSFTFVTYDIRATRGIWADFDGGYGGTPKYAGNVGLIGLNVRYNQHMFSLQSNVVQKGGTIDLALYFDKLSTDILFTKYINFTYGHIQDRSWGFTSWNVGLSYIRGRYERNDNETSSMATIGIPLQLQAVWVPSKRLRFFGLGFKAVVNLGANIQASSYAGLITLNLGSFR